MKKIALALASAVIASSPLVAQAQDSGSSSSDAGLIALAAALVIGIAVVGGAFAQGKIGAAAMDGIARNPQAQSNMFVSMIIGLVLIESLVIYALVIAFQLVGKI